MAWEEWVAWVTLVVFRGKTMPTYVYKCNACKKEQEIVQKITEGPLTVCPLCQANAMIRILPQSVTLQFKGAGFYINDYAKGSPPKECGKGSCGCQ